MAAGKHVFVYLSCFDLNKVSLFITEFSINNEFVLLRKSYEIIALFRPNRKGLHYNSWSHKLDDPPIYGLMHS